jgi:acid phosphatase (class A)
MRKDLIMTNCDDQIRRLCLALVLTCAALNAAGADVDTAAQPAAPERRTRVLGYLPATALPNSLALLPPQPTPGSAALALDEETAKQNIALRGTPRWTLAIADADLRFPYAAGTFSCAVGAPISETETPHLYTLLRASVYEQQ